MIVKPSYKRQIVIAAIFGGALVNPAYAETTLGRWCDKPIPNASKYNGIFAIVKTDAGEFELRARYGDKSSGVTKLLKQPRETYVAIGSNTGDKYRIDAADGTLHILDDDGFIRNAERLENTPRRGDCDI